MLYILSLSFLLGYEIQKLIQFNFFFKLKRISTDYRESILAKVSVANLTFYKELLKITLIDFFYLIILIIGLFTINDYFICGILLLWITQSYIFKYIKNNFVRKTFFLLNILLSIYFLIVALITISLSSAITKNSSALCCT